MTLYNQSDHNTHLTYLYMTFFLIFVTGVGYIFATALNNSLFLYVAIIFSVGMSFVSYWWSDKIVLTMSKAKEIQRDSNPEIYNLVENMYI